MADEELNISVIGEQAGNCNHTFANFSNDINSKGGILTNVVHQGEWNGESLNDGNGITEIEEGNIRTVEIGGAFRTADVRRDEYATETAQVSLTTADHASVLFTVGSTRAYGSGTMAGGLVAGMEGRPSIQGQTRDSCTSVPVPAKATLKPPPFSTNMDDSNISGFSFCSSNQPENRSYREGGREGGRDVGVGHIFLARLFQWFYFLRLSVSQLDYNPHITYDLHISQVSATSRPLYLSRRHPRFTR